MTRKVAKNQLKLQANASVVGVGYVARGNWERRSTGRMRIVARLLYVVQAVMLLAEAVPQEAFQKAFQNIPPASSARRSRPSMIGRCWPRGGIPSLLDIGFSVSRISDKRCLARLSLLRIAPQTPQIRGIPSGTIPETGAAIGCLSTRDSLYH